MPLPGSSLLHEKNPNFQTSIPVETVVSYLRAGGETIANEPDDKITAYLGFLANTEYVNDGTLIGDQESISRQVGAASIALTPKNANAYTTFQLRVARELGWGMTLDESEIDDDAKMEALRIVRRDQQVQLHEWIDELNDYNDVRRHYPHWFKYWALENVRRHTAFNADLNKEGQPKGFEKRSAGSFALFPELNAASLSIVYDVLNYRLGGPELTHEFHDMKPLIAKANFSELYAEAQKYGFSITNELKAVKTGSWRRFEKSDSQEDGNKLASFIRTYRTGWCTAGNATAATQIKGGDFYVWCSTNPENNKDEVPRIAIRMEHDRIAEIRGIIGGRSQELEPDLEDIVMAKIEYMPGGEMYFRRARDMKRLTAIDKKLKTDPNTSLTDTEIRFLYEVDDDIQNFGHRRDPRIAENRVRRAGGDKEALRRIIPETIREQLQAAQAAHAVVAGKIGKRRTVFGKEKEPLNIAQLDELFATKDQQWQKSGLYDYLVDQLLTEGVRHTLVITPNGRVTSEHLKTMVEDLAATAYGPATIYNEALYKDVYASKQLVGVPGSSKARISLIPSKLDDRFASTQAAEHRQLLNQFQAEQPKIPLRPPSVLEAFTYWYALQAQGQELHDGLYEELRNMREKTYIAHFGLSFRQTEDLWHIPSTHLGGGGAPMLSRMLAQNQDAVRLSIG